MEGDKAPLRAVGRVYAALRRLAERRGARHIAVDCFLMIARLGVTPLHSPGTPER